MENMLENVELLRAKANITYEEAKAVLQEAEGDLLDAMILLEQRGKIKRPETEIKPYSAPEEETAENTAREEKKVSTDGKWKTTIKKIVSILTSHTFLVSRKGEELFKMPAWAFVLILFFFWEVVVPGMIIALFFDVRYRLDGKEDMSGVNQFMDQAGDMANEIRSEFKTA